MKRLIAITLTTYASVSIAQAVLIAHVGQDIPIPANFQGVHLDLETGAHHPAPFTGGDINFFFGGEGISNDADDIATAPTVQFLRVFMASDAPLQNLGLGSIVGPASSFFAIGYGSSGNPNDHLGIQFTDGVPGYLGFSLDLEGTTAYGFMEVTLTANGQGVVHGWRYQDNGAPIVIPEPATGILSAFAAALLMMRRRRGHPGSNYV